MESRNHKWANAAHTLLDCEIKHPDLGWIPYTTAAYDTGDGREVWEQREALDIAEYEPDLGAIADDVRAKRTRLLAATDYLLNPDYPITDEQREAVKAYRQALRDIPAQDGFPLDVVWPEKPKI